MKTLVILLSLISSLASADNILPEPRIRAKIIERLAAEMVRLDGEALFVRKNRHLSWPQSVRQLVSEAKSADSWPKFLRTLQRLDLTYPNLHANAKPGPALTKYLPEKDSALGGI